MAATLRDLARWSVKPAKNVDTAKTPRVNVLRGLAARATTPLLPDDYLKLLNPLWSARELRGEVVDVRTETEDSATVTIKPGWGFSAEYQPGQYVGIGLRIDGRWHWRSYSLTSVPRRDDKRITLLSKRLPRAFCPRTKTDGRLDFDHLDRLVPDWQHRPTWACGPATPAEIRAWRWPRKSIRPSLRIWLRRCVFTGRGTGPPKSCHQPSRPPPDRRCINSRKTNFES
jgi:hypothetical protein